jgi:hypothetical protein
VSDVLFIDVKRYGFAIHDHRQIGVLVTGHAQRVGKALLIENPAHVVGLVAIDADRDLVRLFLPQLPVDDFGVDLFDLCVTLHTCGGDIVAIDTGLRVFVGQDVVGSVATGADRGDDQAPFEETVTMDRLRIIFENVVFANRAEL